MTEEEAVEFFEERLEAASNYPDCEDYSKALEVGIHALEQQIPKKIVYQKQSYGTPYRCPECEADQVPIDFFNSDGTDLSEKYSWCWHCGQKLDWQRKARTK